MEQNQFIITTFYSGCELIDISFNNYGANINLLFKKYIGANINIRVKRFSNVSSVNVKVFDI